jgi:hypothetical protein
MLQILSSNRGHGIPRHSQRFQPTPTTAPHIVQCPRIGRPAILQGLLASAATAIVRVPVRAATDAALPSGEQAAGNSDCRSILS